MSSKIKSVLFIIGLLFIFPNLISRNQAREVSNHSIAAFYVFGDSYVDPGNNNYIGSIARSNFAPYGIDFVNQKATGRFSDGKVIADFLASYLGFENYVPYLDPDFTIQAKPAVGFASAGTGFDKRTAAALNVIPMSTQLEYFKEYKAKLASTIGQEEADNQTTNAVFIVNCAVNDFAITYYGPGNVVGLPDGTTIEQYEEFVLQQLQEFVQGLVDLGARRIAVSGVPLFGCWPNVITLYSSDPATALVTRTCNETLNSVGSDYNAKVQEALKTMQSSLANQGLKLAYFDTYTPMLNILQNPANYGKLQNPRDSMSVGPIWAVHARQWMAQISARLDSLCIGVSPIRAVHVQQWTTQILFQLNRSQLSRGFDVINKGCCGTGLLEQSVLCNPLSAVCSDRSKYEFFDSVHLTEAASSVIAGANIDAINSITN